MADMVALVKKALGVRGAGESGAGSGLRLMLVLPEQAREQSKLLDDSAIAARSTL
jgi:hypothetical protein